MPDTQIDDKSLDIHISPPDSTKKEVDIKTWTCLVGAKKTLKRLKVTITDRLIFFLPYQRFQVACEGAKLSLSRTAKPTTRNCPSKPRIVFDPDVTFQIHPSRFTAKSSGKGPCLVSASSNEVSTAVWLPNSHLNCPIPISHQGPPKKPSSICLGISHKVFGLQAVFYFGPHGGAEVLVQLPTGATVDWELIPSRKQSFADMG